MKYQFLATNTTLSISVNFRGASRYNSEVPDIENFTLLDEVISRKYQVITTTSFLLRSQLFLKDNVSFWI